MTDMNLGENLLKEIFPQPTILIILPPIPWFIIGIRKHVICPFRKNEYKTLPD